MKTLFEITEDLLAIDRLIDEQGEELTPEVEQAIAAWFAEVESNMADKLGSYCQYVRKLETESAVAKAEAEQFAKKAKNRQGQAAWLKDRVKEFLKSRDIKKVETSAGYTVSVRGNGGMLPMEIDQDTDPMMIPAEFQKVTIEIDTNLVREHLEAGGVLPFARLKPRGDNLQIK